MPEPPTVSDLIKYVEYPTDLAFGMVDITIPLYEFREGDIVIPISISYHHGSFSASRVPGRMGWGWTLNAGPTLGRKINGNVDEWYYLFANREDKDKDHFEYCYLWEGGNRDEEPDAFYFKTLSASGKFFLTRSLSNSYAPIVPVITPYIPLKIDYNIKSAGTRSIEYFDLTDDNGFRYHFGRDGHYASTNNKVTEWYIQSVVSPVRGDSVCFTYNRNNLSAEQRKRSYANNNDFIAVEYDCTAPWNSSAMGSCLAVTRTALRLEDNNYKITEGPVNGRSYVVKCTEPDERSNLFTSYVFDAQGSGCYNSYGLPWSSFTLHELPLATIEGKITQVDFYGDDKLEKIVVRNRQTGLTLRTIRFDQANTTGYGLLNGVEISGSGTAVDEKYIFSYYNTTIPLPSQCLKSANFAGNYINNGSWDSNTTNPTLIPNKNPKCYFGNIRLRGMGQPLLPDSKAGLLKSITYPTGRVTTFTFEHNMFRYLDLSLNEFSPQNDVTRTGEVGWRIRTLSEFDPITGKTQVKEFRYGKTEDGIGFSRYRTHEQENWMQTKRGIYYSDFYGEGWQTTIDIYTSHVVPLASFNEKAAVHYDYVTEYDRDGNSTGQDNGKTVYEFASDPEPGWTKIPGTNLAFEYSDYAYIGKLIRKSYYRKGKFGYMLSREQAYEYKTLRSDYVEFGKLYNFLYIFPRESYDYHTLMRNASQQFYPNYESYRYRMSTATYVLSKEKSTRFVNGIYQYADSVVYRYDTGKRRVLPSGKTKSASNGSPLVYSYSYTEDMPWTRSSEDSESRLAMRSQNRLNTLLEESVSSGNQQETSRYVYTGRNPALPSKSYRITRGSGGSGEQTLVEILSHDTYGNPTCVKERNGTYTTYIWSYNGEYMVLAVQGATYETVGNVLGTVRLAAIQDATNPDGAFIEAAAEDLRDSANPVLRDCLVTSFVFDPLVGMLSVTSPQGTKTEYRYDSSAKLIDVYHVLKDKSPVLLEHYQYHYRNLPYGNHYHGE
jgi:hypothetical protein